MSLSVENMEKNMAKLTITVPAEKFNAALVQAYNKQKSNISMPGFRKGKVPMAYVEKMYGAEVFYEDAANIVIPEAYEEELKNCDLDIVSRPEIDVEQIEKGKDFIFTAVVAVKPEVTLGEYKGVKVDKITVEVTDEDIEADLKKTQEQNARNINVEDETPAELGDIATIDFEGFVDDEPFDGGKGENYDLELGSHSFIDTFEDQLVGKKIGDTVDVFVTFPEEYHAADLAGKPAKFVVTVKAIKKVELPELDDEFASEVSEFDTLDEYKEDIKNTLLATKEKEAKRAKESAVVDAIIANATMEIPDQMIQTQLEQMMNEFAQQLSYQGLSIEQYFQFTGMTKEQFEETSKPEATRRIQSRLVLETIAKTENIEVSDEEVDEEIKKMADMYQMEFDQIKGMIGDEEKKSMKEDIAVTKAVDLVVEAAVEE